MPDLDALFGDEREYIFVFLSWVSHIESADGKMRRGLDIRLFLEFGLSCVWPFQFPIRDKFSQFCHTMKNL